MAVDDGRKAFDDLIGQIEDYAIIALDPGGTIERWNLGAEKVKGYTADEAIGRSFAMFYPEEDRRARLPERLLAAAREDGRVEHVGWRVRKDGTRFWGDVVITAIRDDGGGLKGFVKVTRDLTEQHELERALRSSEQRLRLLVGQVVDYGILALDPDGIIETWNLGAERLNGYTAEEAIGRDAAELYPEEDRRAGLPLLLLRDARRFGHVERTGWRVRKDGSRYWAEIVLTALYDEDGRLTGYAQVTRDRTDVKMLTEAQDLFYAAFNHDFRTPLTAIKGFADALRDADEGARERLVSRLEASADTLLEMVEALVQFAKQRASRPEVPLEEVDVAQVARAAVHDLAPLFDPDRVHVHDGHAPARANWVAMHRVVTNLLVNALKYSSEETLVEVRFDGGATHVRLEVVDRGRGIDPRDLEVVFEGFQRGRLAEDDGGTGLGLASVRELVHQQHGVVSIESEVGAGTTVAVELPAAGVSTEPQPGWPAPTGHPLG